MELYEVMRTTFAARDYTDDPLPDATLFQILDEARFAPSGGNRQGTHVIVVRDNDTRQAIAEMTLPAAKLYAAQVQAGENPWNTVVPTAVDAQTVEATRPPGLLTKTFIKSAVVLVVCVDLKVVASTDRELDRVGMVSGGSVYPLAWNILLAARNEGFGGTITTLTVAEEPKLQKLLNLPEHFAVAAVMPIGKPVKQLTKLKRRKVEDFVTLEKFDGAPFTGGSS